jgi:4-aminobutyrate aminotransferase-like enzyme
MTITAGTKNNIMRILVPLVVTDKQFDEGLVVIEAGLAQIVEKKQAVVSHA